MGGIHFFVLSRFCVAYHWAYHRAQYTVQGIAQSTLFCFTSMAQAR